MLLLDTSVLVEFQRELGRNVVGPIRSFIGSRKEEDLACSTVTVGELASGESETAVRVLLGRVRKIALSEDIAYRAAQLDKALRRQGWRLGENDNWIAATALHYSATLAYTDGDFDRVEGLKRAKVRAF